MKKQQKLGGFLVDVMLLLSRSRHQGFGCFEVEGELGGGLLLFEPQYCVFVVFVIFAVCKECSGEDEWECVDVDKSTSKTTDWGKIIGHGLRSVQFHSTLSGELIVCLGSCRHFTISADF